MTSKVKPKWEIPSRGRTCCKGEESLQQDTIYYTLLSIDEATGYQRRDYCAKCWQEEVEAKAIPIQSVHWKATIPKRQSKKVDYAEFGEKALLLLREVVERSERQSQEEAFVLGLYLQRLKLIAARQELQREGVNYTVYEVVETAEMVMVPRVTLTAAEISHLQVSLTQKLSSEPS